MSIWQHIETSAGMPGQFHWLVLGFVAAVLLLSYFLPAERIRLRGVLYLTLISCAGLLAAGILRYLGTEAGNLFFLWLSGVSLFLGSIAIINAASILIFAVLLNVARLEPSRIAQDLLVALAYLVAAILLLSRSGVDLRGIVATSAIITAVIAFSLQDTLGNIMSGMALQLERTISTGDWIRVDDVEGRVKEIRWRQTSIETREWDTIVIPNSVLMKGRFRVLGRRTLAPVQQRRPIFFNVDFRTSPTEVIEIVEREIRGDHLPHVATEPPPHCIMTEVRDSYAVYALRYWITDLAIPDPVDSQVRTRVYAALRRAGVPLSIPAQTIFVTKDSSSTRERKQSREAARRLEALSKIDLFKPLNDQERLLLSAELVNAPFVKGETLIRQGDEDHSIYIITAGEVEVRVTVDDVTRKVAALGKGSFFGEMAMMTGKARTSTVVAATDVACYRLGPECLRDIIKSRPEIAEQISRVLAARKVELDDVLEEANAEAMREHLHHTHHTLLNRLRKVFGLDDEDEEKTPK